MGTKQALTTAHVVKTFTRWGVILLKNWDPAFTYKGVLDPNRESPEGINLSRICSCSVIMFLLRDCLLTHCVIIEVSDKEIAHRVKEIIDVGLQSWSGVPGPYHAENPPPKVKV